MTLANLILSSLGAGLALIALGWALDALHARTRRLAGPRPLGPFDGWGHRMGAAPHFNARDHAAWPR